MRPFLRPLDSNSKSHVHFVGVYPGCGVLDALLAVCVLAVVLATGIATVLVFAIGIRSTAGAAGDAFATAIHAIDGSIQGIMATLRSVAAGA